MTLDRHIAAHKHYSTEQKKPEIPAPSVTVLKCPQCQKECKNRKGLIKHMTYANHFSHVKQEGLPVNIYKCKCNKAFHSAKDLSTHITIQQRKEKERAGGPAVVTPPPKPKEPAQTQRRLKRWERSRSTSPKENREKGMNKCICGKIYVHKNALYKHIKRQGDPEKHKEDLEALKVR